MVFNSYLLFYFYSNCMQNYYPYMVFQFHCNLSAIIYFKRPLFPLSSHFNCSKWWPENIHWIFVSLQWYGNIIGNKIIIGKLIGAKLWLKKTLEIVWYFVIYETINSKFTNQNRIGKLVSLKCKKRTSKIIVLLEKGFNKILSRENVMHINHTCT